MRERERERERTINLIYVFDTGLLWLSKAEMFVKMTKTQHNYYLPEAYLTSQTFIIMSLHFTTDYILYN